MSVREVQQYSMQVKSFRWFASTAEVFVRQWLPEGLFAAAIIIAHGAVSRCSLPARRCVFAAQGYAVYAPIIADTGRLRVLGKGRQRWRDASME